MTNKNQNIDILAQLGNIESSMNRINELKDKAIKAVKVPLIAQGANILLTPEGKPLSPPNDAYGVYRHTGGECLGVVGKVFNPMNLSTLIDVIFASVDGCGLEGLDLNKIEYKEYNGGRKVSIDIPLQDFAIEHKDRKLNDVLQTKIQFRTGFDGLTKLSMGFYVLRVFCKNKCANWQADRLISVRNTELNQKRVQLYCNELVEGLNDVNQYKKDLQSLVNRKMTKKQVNEMLSTLVGFDITETDLHAKRQTLVEGLLNAYDIEATNTGANAFSFLQGVTRFTTHEQAQGNDDVVLYGTAAKYNRRAHELLLAH